ncbi:hypothetical protein EVAR_68455_1 [Eumeta japonica]|uniref:Uncharacterized protein n=1 Tax=Eumeta variegata TaxID=151549 RepID=A0A4C2A0Q5_EUMVA|nr:hypothetical protein EVAR_68455_1 [Eumeta japonica]
MRVKLWAEYPTAVAKMETYALFDPYYCRPLSITTDRFLKNVYSRVSVAFAAPALRHAPRAECRSPVHARWSPRRIFYSVNSPPPGPFHASQTSEGSANNPFFRRGDAANLSLYDFGKIYAPAFVTVTRETD